VATSATVTVRDTPTILYEALGPQTTTVMVDNGGAATITLGGADVAAGVGPQLAQSATPLTLSINTDVLYAVAPAGQTATVQVAAWISGPLT
jgi:hypothetical protein